MSHTIVLRGCTPTPMGAYLKALAVFRLISEQVDPSARGWWQQGAFLLDSSLNESALIDFFLNHYRPTVVVAPWNGGSGFSEGDCRDGIDAILKTDSPRFAEYAATIREIFSWPEIGSGEMTVGRMLAEVDLAASDFTGKKRSELQLLIADVQSAIAASGLHQDAILPMTAKAVEKEAKSVYKPVTKLRTAAKKNRRSGGKEEIVRACRNRLCDSAVEWIDSAIVIRTTGDLNYPPLLGTGGTEGRLDYTNTFMERVSTLLLDSKWNAKSANLLRNALFSSPSDQLTTAAVGQLDPGRAGGYNQGPEIETKKFPTNYWDFVLAIEGAIAWTSGAAKRQGVNASATMCSPFTVRARAVGYGSAGQKDEDAARAEIWVPMWDRRCRFEELRTLIREGRAEWNGRPVQNALDFAEAAASLGTDRGISSFQRYSMIKRRGDSFLALPAGLVEVRERKDVDLLFQVDRILGSIDRFARGFDNAPARFSSCRRQVDTAIFEFVRKGGSRRLQDVLVSIGNMERYFASRDLSRDPKLERPLYGLPPQWLSAADDESLEFRIAAALSSIQKTGDVGPIRANLEPVDPKAPGTWSNGSGQVAWTGNTLSQRMLFLLKRRMMDSARLSANTVPLRAQVTLSPRDVAQFLNPRNLLDEDRLESLLFALLLIKWPADFRKRFPAKSKAVIPREYAVLKHLFHHYSKDANGQSVTISPEPSPLSLLSARRVPEACALGLRRLRVSRMRPIISHFPEGIDGVRLGAALLIPVHHMNSLSRLVLDPGPDETR